MISLTCNNHEMNRLIDNYMSSFNRDIPGRRLFRNNYVPSIYLGSALLPLAFNEIEIRQHSWIVNEGDSYNDAFEMITNRFEDLDDDGLELEMIYAYNVNEFVDNLFDTDGLQDNFRRLNEEEKNIYTKALEQYKAREDYENAEWLNFTALVSTSKHMVVIVTSCCDFNQATEYFLTFGMLPQFFQDYKDKFSVKELRYFDEFVHRSSLKRVINSDVKRCFDDMCNDTKYEELLSSMLFESNIQRIVNNRIYAAENDLSRHRSESENALVSYRNAQNKYYETSKLLTYLEEHKDTAVDEIRIALKSEGIVNTDINNNTIALTIKVPVKFYETDEAEIIISNIENEFIKDLFTKLFITQEYKLNMLSKFYFYTAPNGAYSLTSTVSSMDMLRYNAIFNPHIQYFNCLGDYRPKLADAIAKGDILLFTNIAIASAGSINFKDGAVMGRFIRDLESIVEDYTDVYDGYNIYITKCITDSEGNEYSLEDLYKEFTAEPTVVTATITRGVDFGAVITEADITATMADIAVDAPTLTVRDTITDEGDDWLE